MRSKDQNEDCDVCESGWIPEYNPLDFIASKCIPLNPEYKIAHCNLYKWSNFSNKPVCFQCESGYYNTNHGTTCIENEYDSRCNMDAGNGDGTCSLCNINYGYYSLGIQDMDSSK